VHAKYQREWPHYGGYLRFSLTASNSAKDFALYLHVDSISLNEELHGQVFIAKFPAEGKIQEPEIIVSSLLLKRKIMRPKQHEPKNPTLGHGR